MAKRKKKESSSWLRLKTEWKARYLDKAPVLIFGLKFGLLIALLYILLALPIGDRLLYRDLEANAWLANGLLQLLGQHTHLTQGVVIESSRFTMAIRRGCDAIEPTWLLCTAILIFPSPLRRKVVGILAAIFVLQLLNIVRILCLYWVGINWPAFFNTAHMEIWPVIFILVALAFFLKWKGGDHEKRLSA